MRPESAAAIRVRAPESRRRAERVKLALGGLPLSGETLRVSGRCVHEGLPRAVEVPCDPMRQALTGPIAALGLTILAAG